MRNCDDNDDPFSSSSSSSPTSTAPTLASISTISTFNFDFGTTTDAQTDYDYDYDYDHFDGPADVTEIRTYEPIQKAKPVLVHCRGPSPQIIKYGYGRAGDSSCSYSPQSSAGGGYATVFI
jgi:hypothetical protein